MKEDMRTGTSPDAPEQHTFNPDEFQGEVGRVLDALLNEHQADTRELAPYEAAEESIRGWLKGGGRDGDKMQQILSDARTLLLQNREGDPDAMMRRATKTLADQALRVVYRRMPGGEATHHRNQADR